MLKTLYIKNFALFDELKIKFNSGLNILTGETGAGKSLILDALMILMGERASTDLVRKGEKKAIVEGNFRIDSDHSVRKIIEANEYDFFDGELIIRREISAKGNSRCFFNDTPMQVSLLKEIGEHLIDFHGQHDHQLLLKKDNHLIVLDSYSGNAELIEKFNGNLIDIRYAVNVLNETKNKEHEYKSNLKNIRFELDEIDKIDPQEDEFEELSKELDLKENSEKLIENITSAYELLFDSDGSAREKIISARNSIGEISDLDQDFEIYMKEFESAIISVDEISKFLNSYRDNIDLDEDRVEELRQRMFTLNGLRKRYGTFEALFARRNELEKEIQLIENFDSEISKLTIKANELREKLGETARELSYRRREKAKEFENKIIDNLNEMGLKDSVFNVQLDVEETDSDLSAQIKGKKYRIFKNGVDRVEFEISTNKGIDPGPLSDVASGGEISRVMLAIKSVAAGSALLPMLVFDEIDTGISGRIAQKVGKAMKELSTKHQIIAITHLPQIAAMGDRNIGIRKTIKEDMTRISAQILDHEEKLNEVAKLISGEEISESSINTAKELISV